MKIIKAKKKVQTPRVRCPICSRILRRDRAVLSPDYSCKQHATVWTKWEAKAPQECFDFGGFTAVRDFTDHTGKRGTCFGRWQNAGIFHVLSMKPLDMTGAAIVAELEMLTWFS